MRLITSAPLFTTLMIQRPSTRAIPLASTMGDTSRQRENNVTGSQSQISYGDDIAGDADGAYDFSDTSTRFALCHGFLSERNKLLDGLDQLR